MSNVIKSNIAPVLRSYIDRIEKLEEEKKDVADAIKDVRKEAKSNGLDVKTMNEMIKLRKISADKLAEMEFNRDTYLKALGMLSDELA